MSNRELRKNGELAGIRINKFGEVISDKDRKFSAFIRKYRNTRDQFTDKVNDLCSEWNITSITVLSTKYWIGDYGKILIGKDHEIRSKNIYKILRKLYNIHESDNNWYVDEYRNFYYMPEGYRIVEERLIKMINGQYYDINDQYYFSIKESHTLTRWLKKGYSYYNSQAFIADYYDEE